MQQRIPSYSLREMNLSGAEEFVVLRAVKEIVPSNKEYLMPQRRNFYQFFYVLEGTMQFWMEFRKYNLKINHLYFTSPRNVLHKEAHLPASIIMMMFERSFLELNGDRRLLDLLDRWEASGHHELRFCGDGAAAVERMMTNLLTEFDERKEWSKLALRYQLGTFLVETSRLVGLREAGLPESPGIPAIVPCKVSDNFFRLINQHFKEYHQVSDYAKLLHISSGHLNELVKKNCGKTALVCIQERLLLESRYMLFHSSDSVKEIADQLGFGDATSFCKFFRRHTQLSPLDYRQSSREIAYTNPALDNSLT